MKNKRTKNPSTLVELLTHSASRFPRRQAIIFGSKEITYGQLHEATDAIACGIRSLGINAGSRVALFLDNCPEFIVGYYAVVKAGCVVVPINYMFKIEEARHIAQDSGSVALITSRAYREMAEELRLRVDSLQHLIVTNKTIEGVLDFPALLCAPRTEHACPQPDDLAVILYTSGTTGRPKGAMLTHRNLTENAVDSSQAIALTERDTLICVLPLFHSFAATVCMNLPLLIGGKIVLMKSVRPFKRVVRAIRKHRVSIFVGIPSMYNVLKNMKLPHILRTPLIRMINPVRACISGAAALPVDTFRGFEAKFRIPLLEGYGLTEASPVVTLNPLDRTRKPGSIGVPLSSRVLCKVVNDRGEEQGVEKIGELIVKGPNVMRGYYRQEDANKETIKDGWLYTGDMAKYDAEGYYYIVGRRKEMINVRGLNVYPREIEETLYLNPMVKECAVIGIADEHKGEVPKAFIVLHDGQACRKHDILVYLRERLAGYKIPKHVEFRTSLPKNTTGKILKRLLQDEEQK